MIFSAVILAGGQSQRMGRDKAWLTVEGKPLITRQIELMRTLGAEEVFISGRAETDYRALNCPVLLDRMVDAGPLAGIESALAAITAPLLLVLAVDLPKMNAAPLRQLLASCTKTRGSIPQLHHQSEPLAAIYPQSSLKVARELLDRRRYAAREFAACCVELRLAAYQKLPNEYFASFQNWNSPGDIPI